MKFTSTDIANFICANYERANEWPFNDLVEWIKWFTKERFVLTIGNGPKMWGVIMVRPTLEPWNCLGNTDYDQEGDCLYIDIAVAMSPKRDVLQAMGFALLKRFGERSKIAFHRHGVGPLIITSFAEHRRKLLRTPRICK